MGGLKAGTGSTLTKNKILQVGSDGKAPSGASTGDLVVTGGGTYQITGVKSDGSYQRSKVSDATTSTYTGSYDSIDSSRDYNSGLSKDYTPSYSYSGYTSSSGNSNATSDYWADQVGMSDEDKGMLSWLQDMYGATSNSALQNIYHQQAEDIRAKYGYSGGADGSTAIDIRTDDEIRAENIQEVEDILKNVDEYFGGAPTYDSPYDDLLEKLARAALEMKYEDWLESDQYKALAERYGIQGKMSMNDVLGQVASRTGGLASSYATTAAQQQYNSYMANLENAARQMYSDEKSDAISNAELALKYDENSYNKYLDQLSQYNDDRRYWYDVFSEVVNQSNYEREYNDLIAQRQLENKRYEDESAWEKDTYTSEQAATAQLNAQNQITEWINNGYPASTIPQSVKDASGWTDAEINGLSGYVQNLIAQEAAAASAKSSGGSGSSSSAGKVKETKTSSAYDDVVEELWGVTDAAEVDDVLKMNVTAKKITQAEADEIRSAILGSDGEDYGTGYDSILLNAREMKTRGYSKDRIVEYLDKQDVKTLSDAGYRQVLETLFADER